MSRPSTYVTVIRTLFGVVLVAGSFVHLYAGLFNRQSYAAFGDTAWPPLDLLWDEFVMPNIGWLALCMSAFELAVGVGSVLRAPWNRLAVRAMIGFFAFITVLGYAFPASGVVEDFWANRALSLAMILVVVPWLLKPRPLSVPAAWSALLRRTSRACATTRIPSPR